MSWSEIAMFGAIAAVGYLVVAGALNLFRSGSGRRADSPHSKPADMDDARGDARGGHDEPTRQARGGGAFSAYERRCSSCNESNPLDSRYCRACGRPL
ncbi:MAG: zinc ribbon domain-containing protein [Phycisphaerales bacterium]|nr:zinc ribbon domain-containing protein [Phycisphaerales bacterium]